MRRKRCVYCNRVWGISYQQEIPASGYECPKCEIKRKRTNRHSRLIKVKKASKRVSNIEAKDDPRKLIETPAMVRVNMLTNRKYQLKSNSIID